jgi:hypothetical protein
MPLVRRRTDAREVDCLATDAVGDFVYVTGADAVARVDPTNAAKMPAVGIVVKKPSATRALVQFSGAVTALVVLTPGTRYFIGSSGQAATSPPAGPGRRYAQPVGIALAPNVLMLRLQDPTVMVG